MVSLLSDLGTGVDEAEKGGEGELAAGWNGEALEKEQLVLNTFSF
jgi:hypothetical protein